MKLKKLIAVLSALCMMMTMYVNGTGRNFILANADESIESSETTEDSYSGSCGENAVWAFDSESGTLTISGTGEMENYWRSEAPWETYADDITSIVIEEGITTIGEYAFKNCYELVSVSLPSSLTVIMEDAFCNCMSLKNIVIPEGVEEIKDNALACCWLLSEIYLPSTLTKLGNDVFFGDANLESLLLPKNLREIGTKVFSDCTKLNNIDVDSENEYFKSVDGVLFNSDMTNLVSFPCGKEIEEYVIPDDVETISEYAFYYQNSLKSVILPNSLKTIENYAFSNCYNLTDINIPESIEYISKDIFNRTKFYSNIKSESEDFVIINNILLEVISSDNKVVIPSDVLSISGGAFEKLSDLTEVVIPDGCTIYKGAFSNCNTLKSITFGNNCTLSGDKRIVSSCESLEEVSFGNYCVICEAAFYNCSSLDNVTAGDNCIFGTAGFNSCSSLKSITAGDNCTFGEAVFYYCSSLEKFTAGNNCTLGKRVFDGKLHESSKLSECTINGTFSFEGNTFLDEFNIRFPDLSLKYERPALDYKYHDNAENKLNTAYSDVRKFDDINVNSTFSSSTGYNNGYWSVDDVQEIQDSNGKLYVAVKQESGVAIVPHDTDKEIMNFSKDDFKFGSAVFDNEDNIYIMWAKSISDDDIDELYENEYANVVIVKYDKSGNAVAEYGFPVNLMETQFPYDAGNAHLGWKNNVLLVYFHTKWTNGHQGSVAAAVNTETAEIILSSWWQGSHAFGSCMIPTDYGYATIQMGDANDVARGINFNSYYIESPENVKYNYLAPNGEKTLYHSSGQYGTNANKLDGNTTYTHMGGLAKSNTTYAIAGKSERVYTSDIYKSSDLRTGNYDVFVKLVDQTLLSNVSGLAGESRIDEATGEIADKNVIWLTECNETEQAGQVKIVTLEDGSYCVLWEKFVNDNFDSVRYVIMDECGNIIRRETAINNARLSDTSVQPVVYGNTLKWAVGNESNNSLIWYTVNLNEFTSNGELYAPLEKLAKENNISLVFEEGYYGNFSNIYWAYLKESSTLLIAGSGDMNFWRNCPWSEYADSVTNVIIDNNITSIGNGAFEDCKLITSIMLPDSLTYIEEDAFRGCTLLESISLPNGITAIEDYAFYHCENLVSVNIPDTVTELGENVFELCKSLESISLPKSITAINNYAFHYCKNLKEVNLPDTLKIIGFYAFVDCDNLESVYIPESVNNIDEYAFYDCNKLTEVYIGENIENIGEKAFYDCNRLKNITVKSSYAVIGVEAFGYRSVNSDGKYNSEKIDDVTIYGNPDSTVKTYAQENDIEFLEIGSITTTTTTTITTTTQPTTTTTTTNSTITVATNPIIITTTTEPTTATEITTTKTTTITTATNPIIITTTTESITTNTKMTTSTTATESTTLAVTSTTTDTTTEPSIKRIAGDVNGDAKVNFKDVVLIRRYIAGGWNIEINEEVADVNGDGKVNFKDVVLIRRYIAGGWNITLQ